MVFQITISASCYDRFEVRIAEKRGRAGIHSIASETTDGIAISGVVLLCPRKDTSNSRIHYSSRASECEDFTLSVEHDNTFGPLLQLSRRYAADGGKT